MTELSENIDEIGNKPLAIPNIIQLSPELTKELKDIVGDIDWLIFLKNDGEYVSVGVTDDSPVARVCGNTGKVDMVKPHKTDSFPTGCSICEIKPECESENNCNCIKEILSPKPHTRLINFSYTANNTCICINGHRICR